MNHKLARPVLMATLALAMLTACDRGPEGDALARARAHMAQADYPAARVELLNAARQRPADPAVHLATAETLLQLGDAVGGASAAEEARRRGAPAALVAILLGDAANMRGDAAAARRYASALSADHAADALRLRGGALMVDGDITGALVAFRAGLDLRPVDDRLLVEAGYALLASGDFAAAATYAARAVRQAPNRIGPHLLAARAAERQGDLPGALAGYDQVLTLSPTYLAALQDRAAVLGDLRRPREMTAMLDRADQVRRDHPRTLFLRAKMAAAQRRFREAQSLLSRAGTALDYDVQATVLSAQIAQELGMTSLAIANLNRAVTMSPGEHQLRVLLAQTLWGSGDRAGAEAALAPLASIQPMPVEVAELRAIMAAGGGALRAPTR